MTESILPEAQKCCTHCQINKPLEEFGWKDKAKGKRRAHCLACNRIKLREHYQGNKAYYIDKAAGHNTEYRRRNAALVAKSLKGQSCTSCGTSRNLKYYQGLDSQHQPVHQAVHAGVSEAQVLEAIGRSTVMCGSCLGKGFIATTGSWQTMTSEQRQALQAERAATGFQPVPHDYYKRYRPVSK